MASPPVHLFKDRAGVERPDRVQQGTGWVEQVATIATDVRCRLQASVETSTQDGAKAAHLEYDATHAVFFIPTQDIKRDDVLTIRGRRFEVHAFITDSDAATVYGKAIVVEEQEGV